MFSKNNLYSSKFLVSSRWKVLAIKKQSNKVRDRLPLVSDSGRRLGGRVGNCRLSNGMGIFENTMGIGETFSEKWAHEWQHENMVWGGKKKNIPGRRRGRVLKKKYPQRSTYATTGEGMRKGCMSRRSLRSTRAEQPGKQEMIICEILLLLAPCLLLTPSILRQFIWAGERRVVLGI